MVRWKVSSTWWSGSRACWAVPSLVAALLSPGFPQYSARTDCAAHCSQIRNNYKLCEIKSKIVKNHQKVNLPISMSWKNSTKRWSIISHFDFIFRIFIFYSMMSCLICRGTALTLLLLTSSMLRLANISRACSTQTEKSYHTFLRHKVISITRRE